MKERGFDEMIAYFNRRVSEMDIAQDYKMELLGMVTALGYKHEKTAQQWISVSERLPETDGYYLVTIKTFGWNGEQYEDVDIARYERKNGWLKADKCTAWMPLPEPYKREES